MWEETQSAVNRNEDIFDLGNLSSIMLALLLVQSIRGVLIPNATFYVFWQNNKALVPPKLQKIVKIGVLDGVSNFAPKIITMKIDC